MLNHLPLQISYRSGRDHLIRDFYQPCLAESVLYQRAVGYFSSHGLQLAAQGIGKLIRNGGSMRLVASPVLSEEDCRAIEEGYASRNALLGKVLKQQLQQAVEPENAATRARLNALAWLISENRLDIKLALPVDAGGRIRRGLYHEKIGLFRDAGGHAVAFTGSANETTGGLVGNFESIDVYWSWNDPQGRVAAKQAEFDALWNAKAPGLQIIPFQEAAKDILAAYRQKQPPSENEEELAAVPGFAPPVLQGEPRLPAGLQLRPHQTEGIAAWRANGNRGTLQMATGSGKTITALAAITQLRRENGLQVVLILCPYKHLVEQWAAECAKFGMEPILAFENRDQWMELLEARLHVAKQPKGPFLCVISTNRTFSLPHFQELLRQFPRSSMIVADECHNLGAPALQKALPDGIPNRLALSATPERWFDDEGTQKIFDYFGGIIPPIFTLKMALEAGVLCPYRYYPIIVELTAEEADAYLEISTKIARLWNGDEPSDAVKMLLLKRARLTAGAQNKLHALDRLADKLEDEQQMLFYCGDGRTEDPSDDEERRQLEAVMRLLGRSHGIRVAPYTAETPLEERGPLGQLLAEGRLQGLVAIRCLDEGVDIPSVKTAVLMASSTNPRQFIQRRGRILRRSPGKQVAVIYDMIVVPPYSGTIPQSSERSLVKKELVRVAEFADLAQNAGEARAALLPLQKRFNLLDI